jgi:hypothetical protein
MAPNPGIATKVAVLEERIMRMEMALELQAQKYESRLDELNHAHSRASEALATYVPREVYDEFMRSTIEWRRTVDAFVTSGSTRIATLSAMIAAVIAIGGLALAVVNFLSVKS